MHACTQGVREISREMPRWSVACNGGNPLIPQEFYTPLITAERYFLEGIMFFKFLSKSLAITLVSIKVYAQPRQTRICRNIKEVIIWWVVV